MVRTNVNTTVRCRTKLTNRANGAQPDVPTAPLAAWPCVTHVRKKSLHPSANELGGNSHCGLPCCVRMGTCNANGVVPRGWVPLMTIVIGASGGMHAWTMTNAK